MRGARWTRGAVAALMVAGICVAHVGGASPASAEVLDLGCEVTDESTPLGFSVAVDTEDPALDDYESGELLALHSVDGLFSDVPAPVDELGTSPICAVEVLRDAGGVVTFGEPGWMWCTQYEVDACVGGPGTDQGDITAALQPDDPTLLPDPATRLDVDQKADLLAWATVSSEFETEIAELIAWQNRIWCITDGESDIPGTVPGPYVPDDPSTADCAGFRSFLIAEVLPFFAAPDDSIVIELLGSTSVPVGDVLRFTLTSTVPTVRIGVNETLPGDICPEDTSGATLTDSVVTMTPGTTVLLCAASDKVADYSLVGSADLVVADDAGQAFRFGGDGCQVMLTSNSTIDLLSSDTVVLSWTEAPPAPRVVPEPDTAPRPQARALAFAG